mmetsp:Transcript_149569/g.479428  ORF Transcript_149569/g.479428 Transcript_149569/m.479428 type:complete len:203 (-) Transcript_149569:926-1534(-)
MAPACCEICSKSDITITRVRCSRRFTVKHRSSNSCSEASCPAQPPCCAKEAKEESANSNSGPRRCWMEDKSWSAEAPAISGSSLNSSKRAYSNTRPFNFTASRMNVRSTRNSQSAYTSALALCSTAVSTVYQSFRSFGEANSKAPPSSRTAASTTLRSLCNSSVGRCASTPTPTCRATALVDRSQLFGLLGLSPASEAYSRA